MISDKTISLTEDEIKHLPIGYLQVYREQGKSHLRKGNVRAALNALHTAAAAYPEDRNVIVNRGKARLNLGLIHTAQEDAQELLR